jgi:hypothetical protein
VHRETVVTNVVSSEKTILQNERIIPIYDTKTKSLIANALVASDLGIKI